MESGLVIDGDIGCVVACVDVEENTAFCGCVGVVEIVEWRVGIYFDTSGVDYGLVGLENMLDSAKGTFWRKWN